MWYDRCETTVMPSKPSYCRNLPQGITVIRNLQSEWVGRRDLEVALGISKTVAWRLLRLCGGEVGPGAALICRREDLIARLECLATDGGQVQFEVERRARLSGYLETIRPDVVSARTKVVEGRQAAGIAATRFASLPEGVCLTAGRLEIDFATPGEFLTRVGAIIYALHNDYESIAKFMARCEDPGRITHGG